MNDMEKAELRRQRELRKINKLRRQIADRKSMPKTFADHFRILTDSKSKQALDRLYSQFIGGEINLEIYFAFAKDLDNLLVRYVSKFNKAEDPIVDISSHLKNHL